MNQGQPLDAAPPAAPAASQRRNPRPPRKTNAERAATEQEHLNLVMTAAHTTIRILVQNNCYAAVFGSLACNLYGNSRCPKDADILVFPPAGVTTDAEAIKRLLVATAPRQFYLKNARDPAATYRILWFHLPPRRRETKVDILIPGTSGMSLPVIPVPRIRWASGVPLAPFPFILLHKLKGWADHRDAPETFKRARQATDAADVRRLLEITTETRVLEMLAEWWKDQELFDEALQTDSVDRVRQYCLEFPGRAPRWRALGFDVPELTPPAATQ
ncbi:hypothetical protein FB45DRAFT_845865 [Roridomyces roridus]|uniref:Nucleotidyltransferase n=1 Tax=Roridomyces roridus TaxID=1738132 RepID=A0AAD7B380_9AGAR|nr:hypothetical protein FB45DRAFT_845865 [Roridomyces roridus]